MFYLIYKITNNINNKIYIGAHKTKHKNDSYMGSGKIITKAIKKYGIENFTKEILFEFDNPIDMYEKEAEIVNNMFLSLQNVYNIKLGGCGGWDYVNSCGMNGFSDKTVAKVGRAIADAILLEKYGDSWRKIICKTAAQKSKEVMLERLQSDSTFRDILKERAAFAGKHALSEESREKRKTTFKNIRHQSGNKNSQFGKMWITDGTNSITVIKSDILPDGWRKGRVMRSG